MNDVQIEYIATDGKLKGKKIKEGLYYNSFHSHRITIDKCNKNNKEVQRYINDLNYILAESGINYNGINHIVLYKSIKNLSKEELKEIESRLIMYKLIN